MRLRSRLLLITLLPPMLSLMILGPAMLIAFQQQQGQLLNEQENLLLNNYARQMANSDPAQREQLLEQLIAQPSVKTAALYLPNGTPLDTSSPLAQFDDGHYQQKSTLLPATATPPRLQLKIWFDQQHTYLLYYRLWALLLLLIAIVCVTSITLALRFTFNITDPVVQLIEGIRRFHDGNFDTPINTTAEGELKRLEDNLNRMAVATKAEMKRLQENGDTVNEDMRRTMEALEIQNVEIDMARKDAVQSSRLKNEFFNSMNHEIRTALNSILGFSRLLDRSRMDENQREHLTALQKSANNLLNIVNNILDHSRLEEKKMRMTSENFSLRALIEDVQESMSPLAHEKQLEQVTLIDGQLPTHFTGDMLRVRQILANLVSNAVKFSNKGFVSVRALLESRQHDRVTLKLAVSDTGYGLTDEQQLNLFKPFQQGGINSSKLTGSGLGLSICKRLTDEMGGRIGVESEPGKGSTFWVLLSLMASSNSSSTLPSLREQSLWLLEAHEQLSLALQQQLNELAARVHVLPDNPVIHQQLTTHEPGDLYLIDLDYPGHADLQALLSQLERQGSPSLLLARHPDIARKRFGLWPDYFQLLAKPASQSDLSHALMQLAGTQKQRLPALDVMVVDDHDGNLKLAQLILEDMGMKARGYNNGPDALLAFRKQHPDLVLMDIYMPGMDGRECTRRMRQEENPGERTAIYALSAELQKMEEFRLREVGLDGCLTKPLNEKILFSLLTSLSTRHAERISELPPVFDESLAITRCGGRQQVAREMQEMLRRDLAKSSAHLRQLSQARDWQALFESVHKIHGGTRYCGVPRLEQSAGALEKAIKQQADDDQLLALVHQLLARIDEVQEAETINAFMSRTA